MIYVITSGAWRAPAYASATIALTDGSQVTFARGRRRADLWAAALDADADITKAGPLKENPGLRDQIKIEEMDALVEVADTVTAAQFRRRLSDHKARLASLDGG